jgi:hypothetical protein
MEQTIKSTTHKNLRVRIVHDEDAAAPEFDYPITYNPRSRNILGNTTADAEQDADIARKVRDGEYIGIPVWAYVHGSSTIEAAYSNPFGCQWDSGRSGWTYMTKAQAREHYGVKRITKAIRAQAIDFLKCMVSEFDDYLQGNVYGFIVENTDTDENLDSCWGFYGAKYAEESAREALKQMESITPLQLELELSINQGETA